MALKTSNAEIKDRFHEIQQKMELSPNDLGILKNVIDNDIFGVSVILHDEGIIRRLAKELEEVKLIFLKEHAAGDYNIFKKYYKADGYEWDFLTKSQKELLGKLSKSYKKIVQKYFEDRGDLMIYRKSVNSFISSKLKNKESLEDLQEVRGYLLNNYSYHDTLMELGLNPEIGEDGFVKLDKLVLDENGRLKTV